MKLINKIGNLIPKGTRDKYFTVSESLCTDLSRVLRVFTPLLGGIIGGLSLISCSMVNEDWPECAPVPETYTLVDFTYTYNMSPVTGDSGEEEDWFDSHVGAVHLYIFDDAGIYQFDRTVSRTDMAGGKIDFTMKFSDKELIPGQTYQFVSMAQGRHDAYSTDSESNVFYIPLGKELIPGVSTIKDYEVKLDRNDDHEFDFGIVNFQDQYGNNELMIDTIWTTRTGHIQKRTIKKKEYVPSVKPQEDVVTYVEIPMMRITNSVTVNIKHPMFDGNTNTDDYMLLIDFPKGNGRLDFEGNIIKDENTEELYYRALRKKMVKTSSLGTKSRDDSSDSTEEGYALQSVFGVSRLMLGDESELQIRDATSENNDIILTIPNFSDKLAEWLNQSFEDGQEFLDREFDFTVDVQLDENGNPVWYQVSINILGWAHRVWLTDL